MCIYTADGPQRERVKASVKAKIASSWQNVQSTSSQLVRHVLMHRKKTNSSDMELETFPLRLPFVAESHFTLSATLFVTSLYELQSPAVLLATKKWGIISRRFENGFFFWAMVSIRYMTQLVAEIWEHNPTVSRHHFKQRLPIIWATSWAH